VSDLLALGENGWSDRPGALPWTSGVYSDAGPGWSTALVNRLFSQDDLLAGLGEPLGSSGGPIH